MKTKVTRVTGIGKGLRKAAVATMAAALAMTMAGVTSSATEVPEVTGNKCAETDCPGVYENGFCSEEDTHYEAAVVNEDGCYEIGNGGQLYWFAGFVNEPDNSYEYENRKVNAVLTADIKVNENVLVNGELKSYQCRIVPYLDAYVSRCL